MALKATKKRLRGKTIDFINGAMDSDMRDLDGADALNKSIAFETYAELCEAVFSG